MDFPGCCISFLDMALFGAKKWGSWLVLFKGVIKMGTVAVGFVRKVGKALSENQQGKHEGESGKAQTVGADRCWFAKRISMCPVPTDALRAHKGGHINYSQSMHYILDWIRAASTVEFAVPSKPLWGK